MWYARLTTNGDFPPRPQPAVLHLTQFPARGQEVVPLHTAADLSEYLDQHPEVGAVQTYDSRFPQRETELSRFRLIHAAKLWK